MNIDRRAFCREGRTAVALAATWRFGQGLPPFAQAPENEMRLVAAPSNIDVGSGTETWTIRGERDPSASPLRIRDGERLRLAMRNQSMVRHPMHLHGHLFRVAGARGPSGLKDTVLVDPMGRKDVMFPADHPGRWMFHCHHAYHMEAGMARVVEYG